MKLCKDLNVVASFDTEGRGFPIHAYLTKEWGSYPNYFTFTFCKEAIGLFIGEHNGKIIHQGGDGEDDGVIECTLMMSEYMYVSIYNRNDDYSVMLYYKSETNEVSDYVKYMKLISRKVKNKGTVGVLCFDGGFYIEEKKLNNTPVNLIMNYNDDFIEIDKLITDRLSINNSKGLFLLHGEAGTGKTSYIRHLIGCLDKRIIYIPPNTINSITDPTLIKFFIEHSNSILIIEDAENILIKRSGYDSQAISNILNLTDGILSDICNIQVVATFNTNLTDLDEALLRKGRLVAKYEFAELSEKKTKALGDFLGVNVSGKMKLCDIYGANEQSFVNKKELLGFK